MTAVNRIEDHIIKYEYEHDDNSGYCSVNSERADSPTGSNNTLLGSSRNANSSSSMQHDTKPRLSRREIANSNERKRMQSINAGFESLRHLLPHKQGEKLSKAMILQQTAEYIYQLEQERALFLSQNSQLKRLIGQQEAEMPCMSPPHTPTAATTTVVTKKRKTDIEETQINDEINDLMMQLDRERALRKHLEERVEKLQAMYPTEKPTDATVTEQVTLQYNPSKIEEEESEDLILKLTEDDEAVVNTANTVNTVVVEPEECTPSSSVIHESPILQAAITNVPCNNKVIKVETDVSTKADEASQSPVHNSEQIMPSARVYLASTSRQNLETIVEAIRHLEGDNLFGDCSSISNSNDSNNSSQDVPLALTKHNSTQRLLNPFLQFHSNQANSNNNSSHTQQRPGVIVVKQQT